MKVFITGATGFLGYHLIQQLIKIQGVNIIALKRSTSNIKALQGLPITWVEGSVSDKESLVRHIPENVDAVFHMAADTNMWSRRNAEQTRTNVTGTQNMVDVALTKKAKKFIYTSSVAAYGEQKGFLTEDRPLLGQSSFVNYLRTKAMAELIVKDAVKKGLFAVILNPSNVIGTHDLNNWGRMIELVAKKELPFIPGGAGSFCDATEVAKAHIAALTKGQKGHNYILGGSEATYDLFIEMINHSLGQSTKIKVAPKWFLLLVAQVLKLVVLITGKEPDITPETVTLMTHNWLCGYEKAEKELGFQCRPLQEMVKDTVLWMKKEKVI